MALGDVATPSPEPSYSNDPFAPDVTIWPEAPGWLFPAVMVGVVIVVTVVVVLLVMWRRAVVFEKQQRAAQGPTEWVDLSKLDKRGNWEDHTPEFDGDADAPRND